MPRRPKVWFDHEYLASLDAESAPREVFFLSEPAQQALSQLAEIVLWPTRWFNGDPDDSAILAASIYEELKVPAHFDDLIPLLDDVETLLQELIDKEDCCDTIDSVPGGDGIGGVDESTLPPDVDRDGESLPPEYEGDPEAYDAYLCGQAIRLVETTDDAVDAIHNAILGASNVLVFATLVVLAFGNLIGMGIAAILAGGYSLVTWSEIVGYYSFFTELREALGLEDPDGIVPQTKDEMSSVAAGIEDAVFCSNSASEAATQISAIIDSAVTHASYRALLKLLYAISLRPIFWGFGGAPDSTSCVCEAFFSHSWVFAAGPESWQNYTSWLSGYITRGSGATTPDTYVSKSTVRSLGGLSLGASLLPTSLIFDFYIDRDPGLTILIGGLSKGYPGTVWPKDTWNRDVVVDLTGVDPIVLNDVGAFLSVRNDDTGVGHPLRLDNVRLVCEDGS